MNKVITILFLALALATSCARKENRYIIMSGKPAANWNEAYPIGNGHIAAMIHGGTDTSIYDLNEETVFQGGPYNNSNPKTLPHLNEIRKLIFESRNDSAQRLAEEYIKPDSTLGNGACYQTAGLLKIAYRKGKIEDYRRELDLDSALSVVTYKRDGVQFKEESFTSLCNGMLVIRITASRPVIDMAACLSYPKEKNVTYQAEGNMMTLRGTTDSIGKAIPGQVDFTVKAKVLARNGSTRCRDGRIEVASADTVLIYVALATNFISYKDISGDADRKADSLLLGAKADYDFCRREHIRRYREQFARVSLKLGYSTPDCRTTYTRIHRFRKDEDPSLVELLFQYGRYLMISSSQPGCQPNTLQGKWNKDTAPAWGCRYTININTEMNYWPAFSTNLVECEEPYIRMIKELAEHGQETARIMYGCRGWVVHHNTDIWRMTGPIQHPKYGAWPTANAWLCEDLWQYYLYSCDKAFLKEVYPVMRGAALFYFDFLVKDPRSGKLVVSPSLSPENGPKKDKETHLAAGVAMDNEMVSSLFSHVIEAAEILGTDGDFADSCKQKRSQLLPIMIGKRGQLQEWAEDIDSPEDKHRHVSHLWGLYPGMLISPLTTPREAAAAQKSLEWRGDVSTGWSLAWKICLWARLLDGERAYKVMRQFFTPIKSKRTRPGERGGVYPNLLCAHPPFQIDGNFGFTASVAEMLVQGRGNSLHLLPALPEKWKRKGCVKGLKAMGGYTIEEMEWNRYGIKKAVIIPSRDCELCLRIGSDISHQPMRLSCKAGRRMTIEGIKF